VIVAREAFCDSVILFLGVLVIYLSIVAVVVAFDEM
jgi:hypothetical protein